jgi:dienelactone hydrolase
MRLRRRLLIALGVLAASTALLALLGRSRLQGAVFVVRAAGLGGLGERLARMRVVAVSERRLEVPWRDGRLVARLFQPATGSGRAILLAPGVHAGGIEEPRVVGFARHLAELGHPVLAVELPDLKRYQITPRTTDMIEDGARWLSEQRALAPDGRVGLMGISFGGGLSVVAAGRPALKGRAAWVMSLGGHGDLTRVLRFLCSGRLADGSVLKPHDYGVVVILLGVAERVVPPAQVQPLREALLAYLGASHVDMHDKERARRLFLEVKAREASLGEPAASFLREVNARDVAHLGPQLLPHVAALGGDPALSPAAAPPPRLPVFLLHGAGDNVIPAAESGLLGAQLLAAGTPVHVLATPLITHAEVDRHAELSAVWRLVSFWGELLAE